MDTCVLIRIGQEILCPPYAGFFFKICIVFLKQYNLHSQTVRASKVTFVDNVHLPPCVPCRMSHVTYHMSHVTCKMSQSGGASWWRVCYQRGLLRLVFQSTNNIVNLPQCNAMQWFVPPCPPCLCVFCILLFTPHLSSTPILYLISVD